jgi:hypothetical protein
MSESHALEIAMIGKLEPPPAQEEDNTTFKPSVAAPMTVGTFDATDWIFPRIVRPDWWAMAKWARSEIAADGLHHSRMRAQ